MHVSYIPLPYPPSVAQRLMKSAAFSPLSGMFDVISSLSLNSRSFIDASLSIRKTTHANMYQLVVTRAFQEGEEQLLEEDAESKFPLILLFRNALELDSTNQTPRRL